MPPQRPLLSFTQQLKRNVKTDVGNPRSRQSTGAAVQLARAPLSWPAEYRYGPGNGPGSEFRWVLTTRHGPCGVAPITASPQSHSTLSTVDKRIPPRSSLDDWAEDGYPAPWPVHASRTASDSPNPAGGQHQIFIVHQLDGHGRSGPGRALEFPPLHCAVKETFPKLASGHMGRRLKSLAVRAISGRAAACVLGWINERLGELVRQRNVGRDPFGGEPF